MTTLEETLKIDSEKLDALYKRIHEWMDKKDEQSLNDLTDEFEKITAFSLSSQTFNQDLNSETVMKLMALMSSAIIFGYAIRELEMIEGKWFWKI